MTAHKQPVPAGEDSSRLGQATTPGPADWEVAQGRVHTSPPIFSEAGDDAACFKLWREQHDPEVIARFTVDGEPVSKSRARFTKRGSKTQAYTPEKTKDAELAIGWKFRAAAPGHKPDSESTYGVMALFFCGTRQRRDVDNMLKAVLDGLNKIAWADDDQVVEVSGRKSFERYQPDSARTEIVIYRVGSVARPTAMCEYCNKPYETYASWREERRFCSQECSLAWRRERRARLCEHCEEPFDPKNVTAPPKFCSRKCADLARRATVACTRCGIEFTKQRCHVRKQNYCSPECRDLQAKILRAKYSTGTCETCGGPTSKKQYRQCRACKWAGVPVNGKPEVPQ